MRITALAAALVLVAGCGATGDPRAREPAVSPSSPTQAVTKAPGDDPTSGYCAVLVHDGRTYEVADGQQGSGVARPVGRAHGHSCGAGGDRDVDVYTANEQPPEEALTASYGNRVIVYWPRHTAELSPVPYPTAVSHGGSVTAADLALVRRFAQFAVRPVARYRDAAGFTAGGPEIGLGPVLRRTALHDLDSESAWSFPAEGFAGRTGQINVLDILREHLMDTLFMRLTDPSWASTDLLASSGDHTRCAGPPVDAPARFAHLRHLSIEPDPDTIGSCLEWFAIDLYLDRSGHVAAASLDLLEP